MQVHRRLFAVVVALATALVSLVVFAQDVVDPAAVMEQGQQAINALQTGQWLIGAAALITMVINVLRREEIRIGKLTVPNPFSKMLNRIPKRWRILVPILLGAVAGVLHSVASGGTWLESVVVALFTGPSAVFGHEAVVEAMLGKAKSRDGANG